MTELPPRPPSSSTIPPQEDARRSLQNPPLHHPHHAWLPSNSKLLDDPNFDGRSPSMRKLHDASQIQPPLPINRTTSNNKSNTTHSSTGDSPTVALDAVKDAIETVEQALITTPRPAKRATKVWTPPPKVSADKLPSYFRQMALQQTPSSQRVSTIMSPSSQGAPSAAASSPAATAATTTMTIMSPTPKMSPQTVTAAITPNRNQQRSWPVLPVMSPNLQNSFVDLLNGDAGPSPLGVDSAIKQNEQQQNQPPVTAIKCVSPTYSPSTKPPVKVKKLKARWPPIQKNSGHQTYKKKITTGLEREERMGSSLSNLAVHVKERRSTFEQGLAKRHRVTSRSSAPNSSSDDVPDHNDALARDERRKTIYNIDLPLVQVKERRQKFESASPIGKKSTVRMEVDDIRSNTEIHDSQRVPFVQQDDSERSDVGQQEENCVEDSAMALKETSPTAHDEFRFYEFALPSGQKLPKGSAKRYGKRRTRKDRRTNYCISYDGPTLLTMRDHYGLFETVPEADDRFHAERPQDSLPMAPRHVMSPEFKSNRKALSQHRNNDLPPTLPRYEDSGDEDSMESDDEDHSYDGTDDDEEPHRSNDPHGIRGCNRPDVWITPIAGANPSERKWKVKRVWNVEEADDKEEEHTVDNDDLFGKVKDLLGVPPADVNNEDMKAPWKIRKVIDVDGEVEESESESSLEEGDMIQHMNSMASECEDEFFANEDDDEYGHDEEEEDEDEDLESSRSSIGDKHRERAFNRPDCFVSPMNAAFVSPTKSPRKFKVLREWTVDETENEVENSKEVESNVDAEPVPGTSQTSLAPASFTPNFKAMKTVPNYRRSSTGDIHKERAFNRPDCFVSPMNVPFVSPAKARKWKVKREWSVDECLTKSEESHDAKNNIGDLGDLQASGIQEINAVMDHRRGSTGDIQERTCDDRADAIHKQRAFNRPETFVSPMNAPFVSPSSARKWKVKREWIVDNADKDEKDGESSIDATTSKAEINGEGTSAEKNEEHRHIPNEAGDNKGRDSKYSDRPPATDDGTSRSNYDPSEWMSGMTGNKRDDVPKICILQNPSDGEPTWRTDAKPLDVANEAATSDDNNDFASPKLTGQPTLPEPKKEPIKLWWQE